MTKRFEHLVVGVRFGDDYVSFFDGSGVVSLEDIERRGYELVAVQTVDGNSLAFFKREYKGSGPVVLLGLGEVRGTAIESAKAGEEGRVKIGD